MDVSGQFHTLATLLQGNGGKRPADGRHAMIQNTII
jgi:hypothetical protein